MSDHDEARLQIALRSIVPPGILVGCRSILIGDENLLLEEEHRVISGRTSETRQASGAARHTARILLSELGYANVPIGREPGGMPIWPADIKGSLAHDQHMAVATICSEPDIASIGIDVEAAEPLPSELTSLVVGPADELGDTNQRLAGRALFSAKEAIYKASYPFHRRMLDYDDVSVDFGTASGKTSTGQVAQLYWCLTPRVVVLAVKSARSGPSRPLNPVDCDHLVRFVTTGESGDRDHRV